MAPCPRYGSPVREEQAHLGLPAVRRDRGGIRPQPASTAALLSAFGG